jgi:hypothetical protein
MNHRAKCPAACCAAIAAILMLVSCATGPAPPAKGTPPFYWDAAKQTYAAGDFLKTVENLENIVATENELTAKARPWLLVMLSGMSKGYAEISDYFEGGARVNKADPLAFRKHVSQTRSMAGRLSLRFAEVFTDFQKTTDETVPLAFPFPTGSAAPVVLLTKIGNGILPQANEVTSAQKSAVARSVLLSACRASGNPDDVAKTQEFFRSGNATVPRPVFLLAMVNSLHDSAQLYTRNKLDDPAKLKILCGRAEGALKSLPENKETKELGSKIQATLKKNKV